MNDDIEILDKKKKKKEEKPTALKVMTRTEKNNRETKPKKKKVKVKAIQALFCIISALFLLGCVIFYGLRFIKYYRIYNPKVDSSSGVLLAKDIVGKSEFATDDEDGLFSSSGSYIYKGDVKNNYLKYNNMLWRIVRINADNSLDIILDDYISVLPWNKNISSFKESEIYSYLNKDFLNNLDKDMLVTTSFCEDKIDDLTKIACEKQDSDSYVKLLDVANFLNSVRNKKTYLTNDDEIFWLSDYNENKIWHTNGYNVSQSDANVFYEIRPMVRLKNTTVYKVGDGTIDKPFEVGNYDTLKLGSKVLLDEDKWVVYDVTSDIKLMKEEVLSKQLDFDKEKLTYKDSSLMTYLNDEYLNSLSYKDKLIDTTWYIGSYKGNLSDIKNETVKTKVGIPNILDIKFDSSVKSYFTSTTTEEERVYVYENPLRPSRNTTYRSIRPCIALNKEETKKLVYKDGYFKVGE